MTIQLQKPDITELKPRISVFGVGGGGGNAVNNMINAGLQGVEFVVANTDAQALTMSKAERRIQLGVNATDGLGAGSHPEIGREAAEECLDEILDHLGSSHMVFVTAGMGGGTGTGAAPVIARAAREKGILTVGVVTKPFHFEGQRRMKTAEAGIEELQKNVDTLIVIPNQNLFRIANEQTTFADAFSMADQVLYSGVASITDLMVHEGLVNLDFADVRSVMQKMGKAMMGTGEASDAGRALAAAEAAIANPLLDETSMRGARGLLISITGGRDMTLFEVDEAANRIREEVDPDANVIFGAIIDEALEGVIRVSVVATGIDARIGELGEEDFSVGQPAPAAELPGRESGFLKKDSLSAAPVIEAPADEAEAEAAEAEAEDEAERPAENEARPGRPAGGIFAGAPRLKGERNFAGWPARNGGIAAEEEEAEAEDEADAAQQQAAARAAAAVMNGAPAGADLGGAGGYAARPAAGQSRPLYAEPGRQPYGRGEPAEAARNAADEPGALGNFPNGLRETLRRQDKAAEENIGGARGFLKKLQGFFGGSEEIEARLEPVADEGRPPRAEPAAGQAVYRPRREVPYAAAPAQPQGEPRRPVNMGRAAPAPRPETTLNEAQQQRYAPRPAAAEEEKLEIPAFLRRQNSR